MKVHLKAKVAVKVHWGTPANLSQLLNFGDGRLPPEGGGGLPIRKFHPLFLSKKLSVFNHYFAESAAFKYLYKPASPLVPGGKVSVLKSSSSSFIRPKISSNSFCSGTTPI